MKNNFMLELIKPSSNYQNGFVECFNRCYREGGAGLHLFESLQKGRKITGERSDIYEHKQPHCSLGRMIQEAAKILRNSCIRLGGVT